MPEIILLGLGTGKTTDLTCEAYDILSHTRLVYTFESEHPAFEAIPGSTERIRLKPLDGTSSQASGEYFENLETLLHSKGLERVVIVFPGDPVIDWPQGRLILSAAEKWGIPVRIVHGISMIQKAIISCELGSGSEFVTLDPNRWIKQKTPTFPPNLAAVISPILDEETLLRIKDILLYNYPDDHPILIIRPGGAVEQFTLNEISTRIKIDVGCSLIVQPRSDNTAFETFQEVVARLRAPDGCPWDREQTHLSLRQHLLEECYETLEAIDSGSVQDLKEELGDLLLQIVLNSQIAYEAGEFRMADVLDGINTKIIHRHPHVFGEVSIDGVGGVLKNWERIKEKERQENGGGKKGLLDGAPASLPALAYAHEIQDRAARVGFDWPAINGVIAKVNEELEEVLSAANHPDQEKEIGDLIFSVVNLSRWLKVDPESALRVTNERFKWRFSYIEEVAKERGESLSDLGFPEMDRLWEQAKDQES